MNINVSLSDKPMISLPGRAQWVKVNTRYDEFEGKRKYKVTLKYPNKEDEAKMKAICDKLLAEAKANPKFEGKKWSGDCTTGYKEDENGDLLFTFQTNAFFIDRKTGEERQKYIQVGDSHTKKMLGNNVAIGDGSIVRVMFTPGAYWSSARANGINLYMTMIAVDNLVEYKAKADFSAFGFEIEDEESPMDAFDGSDEEIPI